MHIGTFKGSSAYAGQRLHYEDTRFVIDGSGDVDVRLLPAFDSRGEIEWVSDEVRAWAHEQGSALSSLGEGQAPIPAQHPAKSMGALPAALIVLAILGAVYGLVYLVDNVGFSPGAKTAVGQCIPPSSVLVGGETYIVRDIEPSIELRRGDTVRVRLVDSDHDGETDYVDIIEVIAVSGY